MKLTNNDFKLFRTECEEWIKLLGLQSWNIRYSFTDLGDDLARCTTNYKARNCTLSLNKTQDEVRVSKKRLIKENALHECLELFFSVLGVLAEDRAWNEAEYEKERHIIIVTLGKLLIKERL